jgi:hypothetical protein
LEVNCSEQENLCSPRHRCSTRPVAKQYYWPGLPSDYDTYVNSCKGCKWNYLPSDKMPGLLEPLPIGERCWQHVSFDFKSFSKDKQGYGQRVSWHCGSESTFALP